MSDLYNDEELVRKMNETIDKLVRQEKIKKFIVNEQEGIEMKLIEKGDEEEHFKAIMKNKEYLKETLPWAKYYNTIEDSINFIKQMEEFHLETTKLCYLIWKGQRVIGSLAFQILDLGLLEGEIGYWLEQDECGKGIMNQSLALLINYGFTSYQLEKCIIKCILSNSKSANVALRLKFSEVENEKNAITIEGISHDFRVFWLNRDQYFGETEN